MDTLEGDSQWVQVVVSESQNSMPISLFEVICPSVNIEPFPMGVVDGSLIPKFISACQRPALSPL